VNEPYGVLDSGEWSVWCRACSWRSQPWDVMTADLLTFRAIRRSAEADWRTHSCTQAIGAAASRLEEVGPSPLSSAREVENPEPVEWVA
jgi:hypothetical protein